MPGTAPLSWKGADPNLGRAWDCHTEGLALANEDISCVGVSLSYVVVALCTLLEQRRLCRKYT